MWLLLNTAYFREYWAKTEIKSSTEYSISIKYKIRY